MTDGNRQPSPLTNLLPLAVSLAIIVAACVPTTSPPPPGSPMPSSTPQASASPTSQDPAEASPSPASIEACEVASQTGRLPSDRLVAVEIASSDDADTVTFAFGEASLPGPVSAPEGTLEAAEPPYTQGASGLPIEMVGEHVAQVRFAGMSVSNDVGQPTYDGPLELRPDLPALRHIVNYDMFEGVVGWYIGYDGPGCLTLRQDGAAVSVVIAQPSP